MERAAQIISWVFMPLFMPLIAMALVLFVPSYQDALNDGCIYILPIKVKWGLMYVFAIFSAVAPGLSFMLLRRYKMIQSIEMETQKERMTPIIIMSIYCLVLYLFLMKSNSDFPHFIYRLPLSGVVVTALFFLLNKWKKISIHSAATGIATGFVLAYILQQTEYQLWVLTLMVLISGIVMSARMYLQKHDLLESLVGWFTGSLITFSLNYFYI